MRSYAIYFNPTDFPGKFVLRGHTSHPGSSVPDNDCMLADGLDEIRSVVPTGFVNTGRMEDDDAKIVEVWV